MPGQGQVNTGRSLVEALSDKTSTLEWLQSL